MFNGHIDNGKSESIPRRILWSNWSVWGLTPQSMRKFGLYFTVTRTQRLRLPNCLPMLGNGEEVGCLALVLEKIPAELAAKVAQAVAIPVIGVLGRRRRVDGQVLVMHDMLGINQGFSPRFPTAVCRPILRNK